MKYKFIVTSTVTAEADYQKGTSKMIACDVDLIADNELQEDWRDKNGIVNAQGLKAQTQGLIQGLVANIHFGHQEGLWDSATHLRYIIDYLEKGFQHSGAKARKGKQ